MMKALFHHKDIITLNVYAPNNRASKNMKPKPRELQKQINPQLQFDISSSSMTDRMSLEKININTEF